jgi:hypothetical protein
MLQKLILYLSFVYIWNYYTIIYLFVFQNNTIYEFVILSFISHKNENLSLFTTF